MHDDENNSAQFIQLIFGLQSSAWILLGKVMNPMTGKLEKNIAHAKATIDTLVMLKAKTKGNLSKDEEKLLNAAITELQLNYIEEAGKKDENPEKKPSENTDKDTEVESPKKEDPVD